MGYLWENFWKTRKCVLKTVSTDKLISIWEHQRQAFIFETRIGSLGLQNCARNFCFLFRFQDMAWNISCSQNWAFSWKNGSKKWEGDGISKISNAVLKTRYWWGIVPSLGAFQLSVLEINSWEGTKNIVWETAKFLYSFLLKISATKQISWTFLQTLGRNSFTQFSPVDPFENELYEETIKVILVTKCNFRPVQSCLNSKERKMKFTQ